MHVYSDSQLIVKHITGIYRVKKSELKVLHRRVCDMLRQIDTYTISHISRSQNTVADALANKAIDSNIPLPQKLEPLCCV